MLTCLTNDLRNKLLSQLVLALSQALFPFLSYPIITQALGPHGLGKVVYVDSWVQIIGLVAGLGIPLYGIREIAREKENVSAQGKIFLELFFLQLLAVLPTLAILFFIGKYYHFEQPFLALSLVALIGNALTSEWYFQGKEAFRFITIRTVGIRILTLFLLFFLIKDESDVSLYYAILVGSVLLTTVLNLLQVFADGKFSFSVIQLLPHLKKLNWVFGCYLLFSFYALTDSLILGTLSTEEAVGNYNLGYRLIRLSTMFILSAGTVFIPKMAYLSSAGQQQELQQEMKHSQQLIFFFALPASAFFLVMAPELVSVFATSEFTKTATVIRIGSLVPLFLSLSHFAGVQVMLPMNKEKRLFLILASCCMLNLLLNFSLVPPLNEIGSALANLATEISIAVACFFYLLKKRFVQLDVRSFVYCFLLSIVVLPVAFLFRSLDLSPLAVLLATTICSTIFYAALHWLLISDSILKKLVYRFGEKEKTYTGKIATEVRESGT